MHLQNLRTESLVNTTENSVQIHSIQIMNQEAVNLKKKNIKTLLIKTLVMFCQKKPQNKRISK
jgi:hypothetical protein